MKLVIISGFLGAGKTTTLLGMAKRFAAQGKRLAIVENEVGKVGIDDAQLKAEGLEVREIYSGCICCSLRMDLVTALLEIEREHAPDVVILEPSGVAGPKQVLGALIGYGGDIESRRMLSIVDAGRFDKIEDMAIPLVSDGVEVADLVVVNKCDLISPDRLAAIRQRILQVRESARVIAVSATEGLGMDALFDALIEEERSPTIPSKAVEEKSGPQPTVCALNRTIVVDDDSDQLLAQLSTLIDRIVATLQSVGCELIGHVKSIISCQGGGYIVASKTDFDEPTMVKGRLPKSAAFAKLTVNVIVYGVSREVIEDVVNASLSEIAPDV